MKQQITDAIRAVYENVPLVHSITNFVVMQVSANALLAAHASPLMAHAAEEMDDLTNIDSALVLNIGTLDPSWLDSMELAGTLMKKKGKPVVLDPVGAGASGLRTRSALRLLDLVRPDILRGNASEIMALAAEIRSADKVATKGVDSRNSSDEALDAAHELARRFGCVVSVSGSRDPHYRRQRRSCRGRRLAAHAAGHGHGLFRFRRHRSLRRRVQGPPHRGRRGHGRDGFRRRKGRSARQGPRQLSARLSGRALSSGSRRRRIESPQTRELRALSVTAGRLRSYRPAPLALPARCTPARRCPSSLRSGAGEHAI